MARIEKQAHVKDELAQMKDEVIVEVRRSARRGPPFWIRISTWVALLLVVVGTGLALAAASGFIRVPLVSSVVYRRPQPMHVVASGKPFEQAFADRVLGEISVRVQASGGTLDDRSVRFALREEDTTASLRALAQASGQSVFDAQKIQAAMSPEVGIELFLPIKGNPQNTAVRIQVRPSQVDGRLVLAIQDMWIGSVRIPGSVSRPLFGSMVTRALEPFGRTFGQYVTLSSIESSDGELLIVGNANVQILTPP